MFEKKRHRGRKGFYAHILWERLHIGNDVCSHVQHPLCCRFLASREDWIDRPRERERERERESKRDSGRERESPTGGSNNLKDSGLCRWSPTELPVDQILDSVQLKTTPSFSSEIMHTKHTHTHLHTHRYIQTRTHFHSAPFDYSSVSWQQGHLILASDTKVFVNLD